MNKVLEVAIPIHKLNLSTPIDRTPYGSPIYKNGLLTTLGGTRVIFIYYQPS
jgi:hypothetical protein